MQITKVNIVLYMFCHKMDFIDWSSLFCTLNIASQKQFNIDDIVESGFPLLVHCILQAIKAGVISTEQPSWIPGEELFVKSVRHEISRSCRLAKRMRKDYSLRLLSELHTVQLIQIYVQHIFKSYKIFFQKQILF
jgi:hypothetical protein